MVVIPSPRGWRGVCFKNASLSSGCDTAWYQAVGLGASCWASGTSTALLCQWLACPHPGLTAVRGRLRRPASSAPSPGRAAALCSSHHSNSFASDPKLSRDLLYPLDSPPPVCSQHPSVFSSSLLVRAAVTTLRAPSSAVLLWRLQLQQLQQREAFAASFIPPFSLFRSPPALRIPSKQTLAPLRSPNTSPPLPSLKGLEAAPWAPRPSPKLPSHTPS